jgi:hypothetical protein
MLGYAVLFSSPWCGKRRVFERCKPALVDQLQPSTNADKLSELDLAAQTIIVYEGRVGQGQITAEEEPMGLSLRPQIGLHDDHDM